VILLECNVRHEGTMATQPTSFARDIRPLFRAKDINAMRGSFDLSTYDDVRGHAEAILEKLSTGSMPCDGAWPEDQVALFRRWVQEGHPP
jgi:hypothetical protein